MFHPEWEKHIFVVIFRCITKIFFNRCYEELKKTVMRSFGRRVKRDVNENGIRQKFIGFVLMLLDKILTTLNSTGLVAFSIRTILLNVSLRKRQWMIENARKLVKISLLRCSEHEMEEVGGRQGQNILSCGATFSTTVSLKGDVCDSRDLEQREK